MQPRSGSFRPNSSGPAPGEPASRRGDSVRFLLALLLLGVGAALFAIAFRSSLSALYRNAYGAADVVQAFRALPWPLRCAIPTLGGLLVGSVALLTARFREGQGVGDVMEAVVLGRRAISLPLALAKAAGSWLAIATGGSIGREGPLIQFGGALGSNLSRVLQLGGVRARVLVAAGAAAGFAAAYNTPIAAMLFMLEVVTGIAALQAVVPALIATALATTITRAVVGGGPIYGARAFTLASLPELAAYALLGVLAALVGQAFMRLLNITERALDRAWLPQPWRATAGGAFVGALSCWLPEVTGNGFEPLNQLLDAQLPIALVAVLFLAKPCATAASVSSGSPGGVFTPSLFLGGCLGVLFADALARVAPHAGAPGGYALVGMAAMIAATTHAPLMASVLVFELSGDYAIVLPLLLSTALSAALSRVLRRDSIYGAELRRRGIGWDLTLEGRRFRASLGPRR